MLSFCVISSFHCAACTYHVSELMDLNEKQTSSLSVGEELKVYKQ